MKPALPLLIAALSLAACATSRGTVTLLPGEAGAPVGAVAVFDPKSGAEKGSLTAEYTQTGLGGRFAAKPADPKLYAELADTLPKPPTHFTLYFMEGLTTLTPESEAELKKVFDEVARRPGAEVQITGHTDTVGKAEDNDSLSLRRAEDIRQQLIKQGLNPSISRAVGRGARELLVQTPPGTEEPKNRRVEIIVR
ncbi:MAG: OmpA family protein [Proteobacteria bacterium]|nr:OmpA family protein [Pseudomonadota bacterium]